MSLFQTIKNAFTKTNIEPTPQAQRLAYTPNTSIIAASITGTLNYSTYFGLYRSNSDIFNCIKEWQENVGIGGSKLIAPDGEEADEQIQVNFFTTVSQYQDWSTLLKKTTQHLGITGNAYWALITNESRTQILGIETMDPRTVTLLNDQYGNIIGYKQRYRGQTVVFAADEVLHFKLGSDTNNEVYGFSPIHPIYWEAKTDIEAMYSNFAFFQNNAVPDIQYILDEGLSQEEQEAAIKMIESCFKGSTNRHKSGVLGGVKDIKVLSQSKKDMEFLDGRKFTTEKICAAYGVPRFVLGYTETVNNNNGTELMTRFADNTIVPLERLIASVINRHLLPVIGLAGYRFEFSPQVINEDQIEKRALEEFRNGVITLRQYKIKTGKQITPEDEAHPMIDQYIIHSGASATLLEDVGIDPVIDPTDVEGTNKLIKALDEYSPERSVVD